MKVVSNTKKTSKQVILNQMAEPRSLPMGRQEFDEWADRIISGACIPGSEEYREAFITGQKYVLADLLLHLGPQESHKADGYFIHSLRKVIINQVAFAIRKEIHDAKVAKENADAKVVKEKAAADEAAKDNVVMATIVSGDDDGE